jgi:TolA-binding protein
MKLTAFCLSVLISGNMTWAAGPVRNPASGNKAKAPSRPVANQGNKEWDAAQKLYKAQNYKQAAVSFYSIARKSSDMKLRRRAKFYLGVCLYKMNFKLVASFPFVDLVRTGEAVKNKKVSIISSPLPMNWASRAF